MSVRIAVAAGLLVFGVGVVTYFQASSYNRVMHELKALTPAEIRSIFIYANDFPSGSYHEVSSKPEIAKFLAAMNYAEKISPSKRSAPFKYRYVAILKPQEIHLSLHDSQQPEGFTEGGMGRFGSESSYTHYGSFRTQGLESWLNEIGSISGT